MSRTNYRFPDPNAALDEPNGLLAVGGDLSPERLLLAYRSGIFPWYDDDSPLLWWSPNPRAILRPEDIKVSRSLGKTVRQSRFEVRCDHCFDRVIEHCAGPRRNASGTWITSGMQSAYIRLHELGWAHSVEAWQGDRLVGGLYGVAIGGAFFGESMFSHVTDASKVAFVHLAALLHRAGYELIDCQVMNPHLLSLGATAVPRRDFLRALEHAVSLPQAPLRWESDLALPGKSSHD